MKNLLRVIIIIIIMIAKQLLPIEPIPLENLSRPSMFLVKHERIYVLEVATVYIYSLKNLKLIKKFGKAGEGPGEFKYVRNGKPLSMSFYKDKLLVNSEMRTTYFDLDGNYIRETKTKIDKIIFPISNKYIGIGPTLDKNKNIYLGFSLYNNDFNLEKILFISDFEMGNPKEMLLPITNFTYNPVYKKNIFIISRTKEFRIDVYDKDGDQKFIIKKQYPKIKISKNFKHEALNFFKKSPRFKDAYFFFKKILKIRNYFPPIRDIQLSEDFIYVITFKRKGNLWECIKMDLKGNEKGRIFLPLNRYEHLSLYPLLYSVYNKKIYSLVEDEEDEIWKIHISNFQKTY